MMKAFLAIKRSKSGLPAPNVPGLCILPKSAVLWRNQCQIGRLPAFCCETANRRPPGKIPIQSVTQIEDGARLRKRLTRLSELSMTCQSWGNLPPSPPFSWATPLYERL